MANVHTTASVSSSATIHATATVGAFAVIGAAEVGAGCVVHPHVVLADGVTLGDGVEVFPGAFVGKEPKGAGATARQPQFARRVTVGANTSIGPHAVIFYDVEIGPNTLVGDGASIREQCRVGARCIISRYVTLNYDAFVGDDTKIMDMTHITGGCRIGAGVFISTLVATTNDNQIRGGFGAHIKGPVIEDNAVVGAGAILLPGVRIGAASQVAAGAVVTRDVPPSTTVAGVPARAMVRSP